jgi:hypothetical protein
VPENGRIITTVGHESVVAGSDQPHQQALAASLKAAGKTRYDAIKTQLQACVDALTDCERRMDALRSDGDFAEVEREVAKDPKVHDPAAVAAAIGRKKLGQAEMTRRSEAGR